MSQDLKGKNAIVTGGGKVSHCQVPRHSTLLRRLPMSIFVRGWGVGPAPVLSLLVHHVSLGGVSPGVFFAGLGRPGLRCTSPLAPSPSCYVRLYGVTLTMQNLGALIAENLAKRGANVAIHYNSPGSKDETEKTLQKLKDAGVKAVAVQADLSTKAAVDK